MKAFLFINSIKFINFINYFFLLSFSIQHGQNFISYTVLRGSDRTQGQNENKLLKRTRQPPALPQRGVWRRNDYPQSSQESIKDLDSSANSIVKSPTLGPERPGPVLAG